VFAVADSLTVFKKSISHYPSMLKHLERRNIRTAYFLAFVSEIFFPIAVWLFFYSRFLTFTSKNRATALSTLNLLSNLGPAPHKLDKD